MIREIYTKDDIVVTARLAEVIWKECYAGLLGSSQIAYMLKHFQNEEAICDGLSKGMRYFHVYENETTTQPAGYFALELHKPEGKLFLSKLYIAADLRGHGLAREVSDYLNDLANENGLTVVWLTVNKGNAAAIAVYSALGFRMTDSIVTDIGGGYVMDDYVMERPVGGQPAGMRIGQGYDVHRLTQGRRLILGGIDIPYEKGLDGHSDADVLAHSIADALLGAAALGDIGCLFPDTDPHFSGADSLKLLHQTVETVGRAGWRIGNIDATIVAQAPKLKPYIGGMREKLAKACGIAVEQISVKATTEEHLGFTGSGEGIAAQAVCLLVAC